ncbi:MAG: HepT-like ribonuclease domain-containing protein [Candidatus Omnitrophota bacterium]
MLDKERILGKIDELDTYLNELNQIIPVNFEEYQVIEKKRSCERLLQLFIKCIIDICKLFVTRLRLGLPSEENDLFDKMKKKKIISEVMTSTLKEMRDFRKFKEEVLNALSAQ